MRQPRRIAIILKELKNSENKKKLLEYWFTPPEGVQLSFNHPLNSIDEIIKIWEEKEEDFQLFWANNTDLRLPQVLINIGIMPNYPGFYYHKEDEESMISSRILEAKDILFWGNNYDKDNNLLPETRWVRVDEMNTGHLEAIVDLYEAKKMRVSEVYIEMFKQELKERRK